MVQVKITLSKWPVHCLQTVASIIANVLMHGNHSVLVIAICYFHKLVAPKKPLSYNKV